MYTYVIQGIKSIFDKVASWPQLISYLLVAPACLHAASDWHRTFFTPKVFLFSINITRIHYYFVVPPPIVNISDPDTQTVGQSLTLQCNATIGSTIFSGVDIIWSDGNGELNRTTDVTSRMVGSDSVYIDSYTISQLSTTDEGRVIQCEVVINVSPPLMASDSITLDVTGEYLVLCFCTYSSVIALHTVPTPTVTISPSGPIQGAMVGSPQVINCTVSTVSGVESSSVMISWGSIMTDSRVTISLTTSSANTYTSSLQFTYLMEGDEGTYTCNVIILNTSESQSVELNALSS